MPNWKLKQETCEVKGDPLESALRARDEEGFKCIAVICIRHEGQGAHSRMYRNITLAELVPVMRDTLEAISMGVVTED